MDIKTLFIGGLVIAVGVLGYIPTMIVREIR